MQVVKNPPANAGDERDVGSIPGSGRSPEEELTRHSSILSWNIHGQGTLVCCSPCGRKELDTTQQPNKNNPTLPLPDGLTLEGAVSQV